MFIVIEGLDGAGKSTLTKALAEQLEALGEVVVATREVGGTSFAEYIREHVLYRTEFELAPFEEMCLINAARNHHVRTVIEPALAAGKIVLCDRFVLSTWLYQVKADPESVGAFTMASDYITQKAFPSLTLILDVDYATSKARCQGLETHHTDAVDEVEFNNRREALSQMRDMPTVHFLDASRSTVELVKEALAVIERQRAQLSQPTPNPVEAVETVD